MRRWGMLIGVVVAVGSMLGFAYWAGPGREPSHCAQPPWRVSAAVVEQGGSVTLSADDATACDPRYGGRAEIVITVVGEGSRGLTTVQAPMSSRGAFTAEVSIPENTRPGSYAVSAVPRGRDVCRDTNACAAPPVEPLEVIPGD